MTAPIPFLDLLTPHIELKEHLLKAVEEAICKGAFIGGPAVSGFEAEFARYTESEHCVGVGSGTDALRFAFIAAGIGAGDVVITVSNTFIATTEAISQAGARPVFVDIDQATYTMDPAALAEYVETRCLRDASGCLIERARGLRVAAVVPVHLYGQMADMDPILEIAQRYGLAVFEDACQAHGAKYYSRAQERWLAAGSVGLAAAFSFYPGKNLGACGEAGAITTNDAELAKRMRMLRDHGQSEKYYHDVEGWNGRLDALQAAILSIKLKRLPAWTEQRRNAAARYRELFTDAGFPHLVPYECDSSNAVYHLYVIRVQDREKLIQHLASEGIGTGIHYPIPLHLQKAYRDMNVPAGSLPVSERVAPEIVSLPMFPQITAEQQERVVCTVVQFLRATTRTLAMATA